MKKIIVTALLVFLLVSCSSKVYYSSTWQDRKVTIDGNISEWKNPLRFYDQETGISYSISNDHKNLYLACSISNDLLQMKILQSGLVFGIDTLGKKSFPVNIKYPVPDKQLSDPGTINNPLSAAESAKKPDRTSFKLKLLSEAKELELTGFKSQIGKFINISDLNNHGISAAINIDQRGIMYYEAVIPFSTFYKNELSPADSDKVFNYEIRIDPASRSDRNSGNNTRQVGNGMRGGMGGGGMRGGGMRGGSGMGGGGMRGGGMNGNRMSGENGGNSYQRGPNLSGTTKTTVKLKLAFK
jgi:hypothetical protein